MDRVSIYHPRPQFLPFHDRSQRWAAIVCHRRAGKTVAGVNELITRALYTKKEDARYSYIAPFYAQAKAVAWDYLLKFSEPFRVKANIAELSVDLFNGSRCRLFGGDNPDALRGLYHDGVLLDEPAQMKPRLWPEIIRPALADRQGWAVFMGTPQGKNEFWEIWDKARNDPSWFHMTLKASESGILPDEELAASKAMMDEDEYNQEYECSFDAAIRGSFYGKLINQMGERIGHFPYEEGFRVHTCWDLGFTDDTVIWFFQVVLGRPVFFDCYAASGESLDAYIDILHSKRLQYGLTYGDYYLPHDARAHSLQTGRSVQEDLIRHGIRAKIIPDLGVQDGIMATRRLLEVACFDEKNCAQGIEALRQYQREWNEDKKAFSQRPRHDWTSHYADSLRMGAIGWQEENDTTQVYVPPSKRAKPLVHAGHESERIVEAIAVASIRSEAHMNYLDILAAVLGAKPPRQQMPDEQQYGSLAGAIEPALAMGTGAAGQIAGGYAGLQNLASGGDVESSVNKINAVKKELQYEPRTPQGRESLAAIAKVLSPVAEKIEQGKRFLGDNMQDAGYGPGVSTAAYMAPDILASALSFAKLGNLNGFKMAGLPDTQEGVMTYHGSPHLFDKFDLSKVGTGEGAQSFGHGVYLAENPSVAKGYQNTTSYADAVRQFRKELPDDATHEDVLQMANEGSFSDKKAALIKALAADDWLGFDHPSQAISAAFRDLKAFDPSPELQSAVKNYGNLYKVDLPDEHLPKMLDWDKPLKAQEPSVQKAIENIVPKTNYTGQPFPEAWDMTGAELMQMLGKDEDTSVMLKNLGITGIKYLDAGSRGREGTGTRNYVVFDDAMPNILGTE